MRQVILDTETTGLNPATGDRIIEIGCVEMVGRRLTDRTFHYYINPERDIDAGAFAVHGLSREFLSDKPIFANIVEQLIEFVDGAEIVIHNAAFDLGFLDNEFALLKRPPFRNLASKITDTLLDARQMFPGKPHTLPNQNQQQWLMSLNFRHEEKSNDVPSRDPQAFLRFY